MRLATLTTLFFVVLLSACMGHRGRGPGIIPGADAGGDDTGMAVQDGGVDLGTEPGEDMGVDLGVDLGPTCASGEMLCGSTCRTVLSDPLYCGNCDTRCNLGELCESGSCVRADDCRRGTACTGLTYCDSSSGYCVPGCSTNAQCTHSGEVCDVSGHTCDCSASTHECSGSCVSNTSVSSCGSSCTACPTDPNGVASCDGTSCHIACNAGTRSCGGSCATCPTGSSVAATACGVGATCVATSCASGYMLVSGSCIATGALLQSAYLKASNTDNGDQFGGMVAISGDGNTVAVTALNESSSATGVGGVQTNNYEYSSGAVYVFRRSGSSWAQQAYIKASNTEEWDGFGGSLALSADGNTLAVGAHGESSDATGIGGSQSNNSALGSGAVYVFRRSSTTWTQQAYVKASNTGATDWFGTSLDISSDGNTLAVGAYGEASNATGVGGSQSDESQDSSGAVYVFARSGVTWSQQAYVKASNTARSDQFGTVALSDDGNTLAVGAPYEDSAATGIGGSQSDNSASASGAVYVFARSGTSWSQQAYVKASNAETQDYFGSSLALSSDGNVLAVGALSEDSNATGIDGDQTNNSVSESGAVYVFGRSGTTWTQRNYIKASNPDVEDYFGTAIALSGDGTVLAISALSEASDANGLDGIQSDNSAPMAGAVYLFARSGSSWTQRAYTKASNSESYDRFGSSVALSTDGNTMIVGASEEASSATGVGGSQSDNSVNGAGAAYLFTR